MTMDEFCGALPPLAKTPTSQWWQPHGHCVLWDPWVTWTWTICDLLIWASYFAIPLLLFWHLRRTPLVGLLPWTVPFIAACGMGHLWDAFAVWKPWYELVTAGRILTAFVSVVSVAGLAYVLPSLTTEQVHWALHRVTVGQEAQEFADDLLPLAAFVCSSDGSDLAINSAYKELLGRTLSEVRGYQYLLHVHPDDRALAGDNWRAFCLGQLAVFDEQFRWNHPDGEIILRVKGRHRDNGQHYGIVTDGTDEHQHKKLVEGQDYAVD